MEKLARSAAVSANIAATGCSLDMMRILLAFHERRRLRGGVAPVIFPPAAQVLAPSLPYLVEFLIDAPIAEGCVLVSLAHRKW